MAPKPSLNFNPSCRKEKVAMGKFSFEPEVWPVVELMAQIRFWNDPDRETLVADAISVAWELTQDAPDNATPATLANFAVRRVAVGRQFKQSERSIDGPAHRGQVKPGRAFADFSAIGGPGDDPAELVAFRLDFAQWVASLTGRQRAMLRALAGGDRTREVAEKFGCTDGNVSQFRRRLKESWKAFISKES